MTPVIGKTEQNGEIEPDPHADPRELEEVAQEMGQPSPAGSQNGNGPATGVAFLGERISRFMPRVRLRSGGKSGDPLSLPWGAGTRRVFQRRHHPGELWLPPRPDRGVLFTSLEATGKSRYFTIGTKHAPGGHFGRPGWRTMATIGVKLADYDPTLDIRLHRPHAVKALAGYEWRFDRLSLTAMVGGSFVISPIGAIRQTQRYGRFGPAALVEAWWSWDHTAPLRSRFTSLTMIADGAEQSFFAGARHGFAVPGAAIRIGPEVAYSTGAAISRRGTSLQGAWRKVRLGMHISDIPVMRMDFNLGGGVEWRHDKPAGAYLQLTALMRY